VTEEDVTGPAPDESRNSSDVVDVKALRAHIASLEKHVGFLQAELEARRAETQRKDLQLLHVTEAMKALTDGSHEGPPERRYSSETVSHRAPKDEEEPENDTGDSQPPWWRRIFGVPRDFRQPR
jgi:hypothetical protein